MKSIIVSVLVFVIGFNVAAILGSIFDGGSAANSFMSAIVFSVLYLASIVTYFGMQISKRIKQEIVRLRLKNYLNRIDKKLIF